MHYAFMVGLGEPFITTLVKSKLKQPSYVLQVLKSIYYERN